MKWSERELAALEAEEIGDEDAIGVVQQAVEYENLLQHDDWDFSNVKMRADHANRPIWVCPSGYLYLETHSDLFELATNFLVAISEPVSRPEFVHHYKLTPYSLYAAVSVNLDTSEVLNVLDKLSKNEIPLCVREFIRVCTSTYGKVKLVLKQNRLFLESEYPDVLKKLLRDDRIRAARIQTSRFAVPDEYKLGAAGVDGEAQEEDVFMISERAEEEDSAKAANLEAIEAVELERLRRAQKQDDEDEDAMLASGDVRSGGIGGVASLAMARKHRRDGPKRIVAASWKSGTSFDPSKTETDDSVEHKPKSALDLLRGKLGSHLGKRGTKRDANDTVKQDAPQVEKTEEEETKKRSVVSFEIRTDQIEHVKHAAYQLNYPLMEEYDFRRDNTNPDLPIVLTGKLRYYQEKALGKMFGNGRARSGVIVLPCGAGKTLTGITATCTIKKSCIVFCTSSVAVEQWERAYKTFTKLDDRHYCKFTSMDKQELPPNIATVLITTYTMMAYPGERDARGAKMMKEIEKRDWGLILMDEVHVVPAKMFRKALSVVKAHSKLGLTATLVREDNLITDLNFLIGPKLYEANWMKLTDDGFLARVLCCEVWCPMTPMFFRAYLEACEGRNGGADHKRRMLLYVMNPIKYTYTKVLMNYHERKGDKILIFSDNVPALEQYGVRLHVNVMYGKTKDVDRESLLRRFRGVGMVEGETEINVLIISKIGDVAIDLPQANVIIQVSSHFGSRRQEAQRLGRILRPKPGNKQKVGFQATFYSLVSTDTAEMFYSNKRQQYLVDQGYTFKVIKNLDEFAKLEDIEVENVTPEMDRQLLERLNYVDAGLTDNLDQFLDDDITNGGQGSNLLPSSSRPSRKKSNAAPSIKMAPGLRNMLKKL